MTARSPNCVKDDRGAIMVLALFFSIFGVALMFAALETAQATLFRERMQDAADAAALSDAIMHARFMNLIVLINILMAALLAILITIKLVESIAIVGMAVAAGLSWVTFGASLAAIPPLRVLETSMQSVYSELKEPIFRMLETLHDLADVVKGAGPVAAEVAVMSGGDFWKPEAQVPLVIPPALTLPVEDDTFDKLCGKAGELPAGLAGQALAKVVPCQPVVDALDKAMSELTSSVSSWFCGDGDPKPYTYSTDPTYPSANTACLKSASKVDCEKAVVKEAASRPDDTTGNCRAGTDCSLGGPYDERLQNARAECSPTQPNPPEKYIYQVRTGKVVYRRVGDEWVRKTPVYASPRRVESAYPPCGSGSPAGTIGKSYDPDVRKTSDVTDVDPVCSDEKPPSMSARPGSEKTVSFTEVLNILGCQKHETKTLKPDVSGGNAQSSDPSTDADEGPSKSDGESKSGKKIRKKQPKQVLADAKLGDSHFQIRAIVHGSFSSPADAVIRLALFGAKPDPEALSVLGELGHFAVAQAEFFYEGAEGRGDWMWNMGWRGRLRRFRVTTDGKKKMTSKCGKACGALLGSSTDLNALIAH